MYILYICIYYIYLYIYIHICILLYYTYYIIYNRNIINVEYTFIVTKIFINVNDTYVDILCVQFNIPTQIHALTHTHTERSDGPYTPDIGAWAIVGLPTMDLR
eukprot:GHVR01172914.1.p1 GENE.GHVR01172914.1~~GHVR01172914.1.p1  ORF type:complete len:110 (-),score=14.27 GHVR01172914.1:90-398(-)